MSLSDGEQLAYHGQFRLPLELACKKRYGEQSYGVVACSNSELCHAIPNV